MTNLLKRYIRLLTVLFGAGCSHLTEVQGVYQVLAEKIAVYETMSAELIAETLWRVSHLGQGCSPSSIRSATISEDAPFAYHQLPGDAAIEPTIGGGGVTGRQRRRAWRPTGYGGGSVSSATLSTMTGSAPREPAPLIGGKRTNPTPIPEVVAIMQGLRAKRPGVDMNALMRSREDRHRRDRNRGQRSVPGFHVLWRMRQSRMLLQPRPSTQRVGRQAPRLC